jgi:hypothetical protein
MFGGRSIYRIASKPLPDLVWRQQAALDSGNITQNTPFVQCFSLGARKISPSPSRSTEAAGIEEGPHACPKGLRHGFGVAAVSKGIALNMVQKWLGHAQLTTTAIYANAVGEEEQSIAARMWT